MRKTPGLADWPGGEGQGSRAGGVTRRAGYFLSGFWAARVGALLQVLGLDHFDLGALLELFG